MTRTASPRAPRSANESPGICWARSESTYGPISARRPLSSARAASSKRATSASRSRCASSVAPTRPPTAAVATSRCRPRAPTAPVRRERVPSPGPLSGPAGSPAARPVPRPIRAAGRQRPPTSRPDRPDARPAAGGSRVTPGDGRRAAAKLTGERSQLGGVEASPAAQHERLCLLGYELAARREPDGGVSGEQQRPNRGLVRDRDLVARDLDGDTRGAKHPLEPWDRLSTRTDEDRHLSPGQTVSLCLAQREGDLLGLGARVGVRAHVDLAEVIVGRLHLPERLELVARRPTR